MHTGPRDLPAEGFGILQGTEAPLMAKRTTLRLGGPVLAEVSLFDPGCAGALPELAGSLGGRLVCLGAGSNILAGEGRLPLVTVRNALPPEIAVMEDTGRYSVLRACGSVKLPVLLARAAAMNLAGLEGLSGIPGTVGGAVAMNAGSFGETISDTLVALEIVTERGEVLRYGRDALDFGYRRMAIPSLTGWWMVLSADFRLAHTAAGSAAARGREFLDRKRATQPVTAASAGCVFKNISAELPAGKLLDEAGYRGKRLGGMRFSPIHANFLVNEGTGTSAEALELLTQAKEAVLARFGLRLETEVRIWV